MSVSQLSRRYVENAAPNIAASIYTNKETLHRGEKARKSGGLMHRTKLDSEEALA